MIIIPYKPSNKAVITDSIFWKNRCRSAKNNGFASVFLRRWWKRDKIGTPPAMTIPVAGSYDAANGTLTVVKFRFNEVKNMYVNSM